MGILLVATKSPWPPADGGRRLMCTTIAALHHAGHAVTLVAPWSPADGSLAAVRAELSRWCRPELVPAQPPSWARAFFRSVRTGQPASLARHASAPVRARVASLLESCHFDVVHAEQLQAVAQCAPAIDRGLPIVLRAQNVESDLWTALAGTGGSRARLAAFEARRLARAEGAAVRAAAVTVALSAEDAARLRELAGGSAPVRCVAAPFERELPGADLPLAGAPPLVILGSAGWLPNRIALRWFLGQIWPAVAAAVPGAVLHVFGAAGRDIRGVRTVSFERHPPPGDSRTAFAPNAMLLVPVRMASGVRVKILEAWARGVPVVATPEAAAGLGHGVDEALLLASTAAEFAGAVARLRDDRDLRSRLTRAGRARLGRHHAPAAVAQGLAEAYEAAIERASRGDGT